MSGVARCLFPDEPCAGSARRECEAGVLGNHACIPLGRVDEDVNLKKSLDLVHMDAVCAVNSHSHVGGLETPSCRQT